MMQNTLKFSLKTAELKMWTHLYKLNISYAVLTIKCYQYVHVDYNDEHIKKGLFFLNA